MDRKKLTVIPYGDYHSAKTYYTLLEIEDEFYVKLPKLSHEEGEQLFNKLIIDVAKTLYGGSVHTQRLTKFTKRSVSLKSEIKDIKTLTPFINMLELGSKLDYRYNLSVAYLPCFEKKTAGHEAPHVKRH